MQKIDVKPMSVNNAWQGKRFKTKEYDAYSKEVLLKLKPMQIPSPPFRVYYEFGLSNVLSDWDNPIKPIQDLLQKKFGFNDRDIFEAMVKKVKVDKGKEYILFDIQSL